MEKRLLGMFKEMMREQDSRNGHRIAAMETALRKEMAAIVNRDEARIVSVDETEAAAGGAAGGATAAAATGPLLKVPATTMPPPKLSFLTKLSEFDSWRASWDAYLQTAGVLSIASEEARRNRARSLLTQAFDDDLRSWVMSQLWYTDAAVNSDVDLVLDRIREKIEQEDDPFTVFATLMARPWQANADTADTFWVDIQTRVRYCGLRDAYHTDHVLRTLWASRYGDEEAKKEFALHPKWSAADCYRKAKGLEQVKQRRNGAENGIDTMINAVRQSAYKKGGGKSGGGGGFNGANKKANAGSSSTGRRAGTNPSGPKGVRAASCLNCGFDTHRGGVCPAQGQACKACGTVGHYAKHCPVRDANAVIMEDDVRVCNAVQTSWSDEVDAASEDDRAATIAVANSKPPAARKQDWQDAEYEIGNRCEVRNGDKWLSATITGSYPAADGGPRVCAVLVDETNDIWQVTADSVVIRKKCDRGKWVPVKRPIRGRGPTVKFAK
jgi:hypothetical protein